MLRALFSQAQKSNIAGAQRSGSTRQARFGVTAIALGLLVPASFALAGPADAHTPKFKVDCTTATVNLTNYNAGATNTITVNAGSKTLVDEPFDTAYEDSFTLPDHDQPLKVVFSVKASDDPDGHNGWTVTEELISPVCTTSSSSSNPPPSTTTSPPPSTTTTPPPSTTSTTPPPTTTTAAPVAAVPTAVDLCGTNDDTFTIPEVSGVAFYVGANELQPGTHAGSGTVTVTAVGTQDQTLAAPTEWTFTWTNEACVESGTAIVPTAKDMCGTANDTYTLPAAGDDYSYTVNSTATGAGTHAARGTVTVVAVAAPGYVLVGPTTWTFTYTDEACLAVASQNGLANTGADLKVPLLAGGLLLVVGGGLLYGARRRS